MEDKDIKHLTWIYERLVHVHNENPNSDYMIRLKQIVDKYYHFNCLGPKLVSGVKTCEKWCGDDMCLKHSK